VPTFFEALNELMAAETPLVTVTVVDTAGSVPQNRGSKMIVTRDGRAFGTVGGGKVETKAIAEAKEMLRDRTAETSRFVQWNLSKDVGMTCGGIATSRRPASLLGDVTEYAASLTNADGMRWCCY